MKHPPSMLKLLRPEIREYKGFCGIYGTHIYASDLEKTVFNTRVGCLEMGSLYEPSTHIFEDSSILWLNNLSRHTWLSRGPIAKKLQK